MNLKVLFNAFDAVLAPREGREAGGDYIVRAKFHNALNMLRVDYKIRIELRIPETRCDIHEPVRHFVDRYLIPDDAVHYLISIRTD